MALRPTPIAVMMLLFVASAASGQHVTAEQLDQSIDLGRTFLLSAQREDGSFVYEFDAVRGADAGTRNAIREMGGLWAIALLHRRHPTPETASAIVKALKLQDTFAKTTPGGGRYLAEPDAREWTTNTVALHMLAMQDVLATKDDKLVDAAIREKCERDLAAEAKFLLSLRLGNGRFSSTYHTTDGKGLASPTPYSDGEVLLALIRRAKQDPKDEALRQSVLESAAIMYSAYVRGALRADPNNEQTRAFYQWGSMAFYELYTAEWPGTKPYAPRAIAMARWMIDVQHINRAIDNGGHAFEGLAAAWELARLTGDAKNQQYIGAAIDRGLARLMSWQIGNAPGETEAVPKTFLRSQKARGGVVSLPGEPKIRIDTVQHQMHAEMLARKFMFRGGAEEAAIDRK
jgi:UDP-N-acetylmuramoyl-tripeptide--D-alanyl-D-alanine ligase